MKQERFHNAPLPANKAGFTLVEISIVMIIIGLLIGGIFSGMKLIDNANIQKTVQDLKAIDTAVPTFRDTYRALPGDIRSPSTRIPNCTIAPCSVGGNGDRGISPLVTGFTDSVMTLTDERFTFWHHLQAADLIQMNFSNMNDMNFGEGQPTAHEGGGYRLRMYVTGTVSPFINVSSKHILFITGIPSDVPASNPTLSRASSCTLAGAVDRKMDDGLPRVGKVLTQPNCTQTGLDDMSPYGNNSNMTALNFIAGF
jgi:prepilin-type N-terminal cleavage/methylation domain-containing protein